MFLPLGLGLKLARLPLATILIAVALFAIHWHRGSPTGELYGTSKELLNELQAKQRAALQAHCGTVVGDARVCQMLISAKFAKVTKPSQFFAEGVTDPTDEELKVYRQHRKTFPKAGWEKGSEPAVRAFRDAEMAFAAHIETFAKERNLLTPGNMNAVTLLWYQFLHGGWAHLIGNMIALIAFGIYLEQVVGSLLWLGIFLAGGVASGVAELVATAPEDTRVLVGASGSISALMGAFFVIFFHRHLALLFTMVVYNRVILAPVSFAMPLIYVANDIAAVSSRGNSGVAHLAHLGGFAFGCVAAMFLAREVREDAFAHYPQELELERVAKQSRAPAQRESALREILALNPANLRALERLVGEWRARPAQKPAAEDRELLTRSYRRCAGSLRPEARLNRVFNFLSIVPPEFAYAEFCEGVSQKELLLMGARAEQGQKMFLTLRLLELYLSVYGNSAQAPEVRQHLSQMLRALAGDANVATLPGRGPTDYQQLQSYALGHPRSLLAQAFRQLSSERSQPEVKYA